VAKSQTRQAEPDIGNLGVTYARFGGTCISCKKWYPAGTRIQKWIGGWQHSDCKAPQK
jgi:hypothetical protein